MSDTPNKRQPNALVAGLVLLVVGALAAAALSFTRHKTAGVIADNEHAYAMRQLHELIGPDEVDNNMLNDFIRVRDKDLLGGTDEREIYRAFRGTSPVGAIVTTVAPNGYSGPIKLLVGIYADGRLAGVRLVSHRETPGLGDKIEPRKSDWLRQFVGRSLVDPTVDDWSVRRDGGRFDQFTGATVTPRAVVAAVRDALLYFEAHQDEIFAAPARTD